MNATPNIIAPHRLCWIAMIFAAVVFGLVIPLTAGLKLQFQLAAVLGLAGLIGLLVVPNRRLALVCAWVFVIPLSIEKVFPLHPTFQGLLPPAFVISGSDLVLYTLAVVSALEALVEQRAIFYWPAAATPFALLVGWVTANFLLHGANVEGALQVMHWLKLLFFILIFSSAIRSREELLAVLATMALAVLLQSVILGVSYVLNRKFGFSDKAAGAMMMSFSSGNGGNLVTRATGTVGHVNQQAMFHTFFTIPIAALLTVRNWAWRGAVALVIVASFCAIILTFSRASWIACTLAATVIIFAAWRNGRIGPQGWLGLYLGLLVASATVAAFSGAIISRLTKGDDGASSSRVRAALIAIEHVSFSPLTGVGPGNFVNAKLKRNPLDWTTNMWLPRGTDELPRDVGGLEMQRGLVEGRWYYLPGMVHNKFLLLAAELGLVGLALFLWFQWRVFRHAWRGLRTRDPMLWWIAICLVGFFCASLVEYMFEFFYDDKTMLIPLFVIILIINLDRLVGGSAPEEVSCR